MKDESRLTWIHDILRKVAANWANCIPSPISTTNGASFLREHHQFWEMSPWIEGNADYRLNPSEQKFANAIRAVARFHHLAGGMEVIERPAPGLLDRISLTEQNLEALEQFEALQFRTIDGFGGQHHCEEAINAFRKHGMRLHEDLTRAKNWNVPLQVCIRDVRQEHVLFRSEEVAGLIDFGTMRIDHVGLDLARLIGTMEEDCSEAWDRGIEAYHQAGRPLSSEECQLIRLYDRATVLLAGLNWVRWIYLEQREFEDWRAVQTRLSEISRRLPFVSSGFEA